jgi:hypothetical protein
MRHPSTRGERRYARELARNRRRKHLFIYRWPNYDPRENRGWSKGGKQYIAHGNRCFHSMADRPHKIQCAAPPQAPAANVIRFPLH